MKLFEGVGSVYCTLAAAILLVSGIYFLKRAHFFPFRKCGYILKNTMGQIFKKNSGSSVRSFATSIAGTIGIGNIIGVAWAIRIGGPGAVFWIWMSALTSMMIKYSEIFLTLRHREKRNIGPICYMQTVIRSRPVLKFYAILIVLSSILLGNMVQINAASSYIYEYSHQSPLFIGIILTIIVVIVLCRNSEKMTSVLIFLVPIMGALYLIGGAVILFSDIGRLSDAFVQIFQGAFSLKSATGGFLGSAMLIAARKGCMNGLFSHEAGVGSSAFAHSQTTDVPAEKEGLWGIVEVFIDSIVISSITALILISTAGPDGQTQISIMPAFIQVFGDVGGWFCIMSVALFSISSMISWNYYGRCGIDYVKPSAFRAYMAVYLISTFIATQINTSGIWSFAEIINSTMMLINLYALVRLRKQIRIE